MIEKIGNSIIPPTTCFQSRGRPPKGSQPSMTGPKFFCAQAKKGEGAFFFFLGEAVFESASFSGVCGEAFTCVPEVLLAFTGVASADNMTLFPFNRLTSNVVAPTKP